MTRAPLATRRPSEIISFTHGGIPYTGQVSYRPDDGAPCETFLDGGRTGSAIQAVSRDTAVAASLALQFGCPIDVLRTALTRTDECAAAGPLGALLDMVVGA